MAFRKLGYSCEFLPFLLHNTVGIIIPKKLRMKSHAENQKWMQLFQRGYNTFLWSDFVGNSR
jgi:hypothetical protein